MVLAVQNIAVRNILFTSLVRYKHSFMFYINLGMEFLCPGVGIVSFSRQCQIVS